MFAVINTVSGVVGALKETDDPIADIFTVAPVSEPLPSVGDVGEKKANGSWIFSPPKEDPAPEAATAVTALDLWSRLSDDEADQVGGAMASQPFRIRQIFQSAVTYRSDHELWPLLTSIAEELFGKTRAAEILAPSTGA